jgi:tetratricopeptide (TPR) repeat protein
MTWMRWSWLVGVMLLLSPLAWADEAGETFDQSLEALKRKEFYLAIAGFSAVLHLEPANAAAYHNRASAYHGQGRYDRAIADYTAALRIDPQLALTLTCRGTAYKLQGDYDRAVADYRAALQVDANSSLACNNLAALLASCPRSDIRNGQQAVTLATKACTLTGWHQALYLDTLAAAYAESGDFKAALSWQKKAVALGTFSGKDRDEAYRLLTLYAEGKPYHEEGEGPLLPSPDQDGPIVLARAAVSIGAPEPLPNTGPDR